MIYIHNLWKCYGKNQVLKGLTLKIEKGETLVILGRSGVGKSVLLKHIVGIAKGDQGYIEVGGVRISDLDEEKRCKAMRNMGMLFQGAALFDSMNVGENTAFYLQQHGNLETGRKYSRAELADMVDHALEIVGLSGVQKKMPADLSGGMRKRAGLARLIVYRPEYILYDEPTTGLDPITAMQINELILKTQEELKATSVVVTHDLFSALFVADRLALHKEGKIAHIGKPDAFLQIEDPIIQFLKKMTEGTRSYRRKSP